MLYEEEEAGRAKEFIRKVDEGDDRAECGRREGKDRKVEGREGEERKKK